MPKGVTYVLKSDECDAVNVPPDPRVSWWMNHGHVLPLRDPSGNSFGRLKEREEEFVQLQERLKEYMNG
jgi:hypothetical protein